MRWLLSQVSVDPRWVDEMRQLCARGPVVHVLLRLNLIDFLVLDQICRVHDLPPIRMITGVGRYRAWPFRWLLTFLWRRCRSCDVDRVSSVIGHGESLLLFLRPRNRRAGRRPNHEISDTTEALVRLQRGQDRPVQLVSHVVLWGRRRQGSSRGAFWSWWLQQLREGPGILRLITRVVGSTRNAQIRMGQPLELTEMIDREPEGTDEEVARQVRFSLRRRLEQARKVVLGPMAKSAEVIRDELLRNPVLVDQMREIASDQGVAIEKVKKRARKLLREIMAVPKSGYLAAVNTFLWWAWSRLFDGIEVDREGLARWREVAHEGPLVIVSSHKSHVDYLILSQLFWEGGIFPPHIAAGRNLSFWPVGAVFRGCGAFFIRRHFLDDRLYVEVMQAYITKILQEGYHLEFFIEGTRSRSGKMLPPKLGLLGMIVDAARRLRGYTVHIAPVSVTYGRVPEEGSHTAELAGGEKRSEDIGGLLRTRHALQRRHGVLYVQFGTPIDVSAYFEEQGVTDVVELGEEKRRQVVTNLAYRTVHEINRVTRVIPTSLVASALLLNRRRGMTHATLRAEVDRLVQLIGAFGGRFSSSLDGAEERGVPEAVLSQAVAFLSDAGLVSVHDTDEDAIYTVASERRLALDYYKNQTLHTVSHAMVVAAALGCDGERGRSWTELSERVRFLSRLFKYEFIFRADAVLEVNLEKTIDELEALELVERFDGRVVPLLRGPRPLILTLAAMLESFIESYRIVVRQLRMMPEQAMGERELVKAALERGEGMYLVGEIELREAVSKINFQHALRALRDLDVLHRLEGRQVTLTEAFSQPGALVELEQQTASFLERQ